MNIIEKQDNLTYSFIIKELQKQKKKKAEILFILLIKLLINDYIFKFPFKTMTIIG